MHARAPAPLQVNRSTLRALLAHLLRVASHSSTNLMTIEQLSMCVYTRRAATVQLLLENFKYLFPPPSSRR